MTQPPDIQNLVDQSRSTDLHALLSAKEECKRRMLDDPTPQNIAAWEKSSRALEKAISAAQQDANSADGQQPDHANMTEAIAWMQQAGFKIKKSKVYGDRKKGKFHVQPDGRIRHADVLAYIHTEELSKAPSMLQVLEDISTRKQEKEIEKLTAQVEKLQFDLDRDRGKYLPKEEVRTELALKIAALESGLKHMIRIYASDWVGSVGGDIKKAPVLIGQFTHRLDELLDEMGNVEELELVVARES